MRVLVMILPASLMAWQQISLQIVRLWDGGVSHSREGSIRNLAVWRLVFCLSQRSRRSLRGRFPGQEGHVHGIDYESHAKLSR